MLRAGSRIRGSGGWREGGLALILWTGEGVSDVDPSVTSGVSVGRSSTVTEGGSRELRGGEVRGVEPSGDPVYPHCLAHALAAQLMHGWMMN